MNKFQNFLTTYINFTEPNFIQAIQYSMICFLGWIILPHLQYKYKILSRLSGGNQSIACDFLAFFLIYTGFIRNQAINQAIYNSKTLIYGFYEIPTLVISYFLMLFGGLLVSMSFYRLGLRGMYFGDHFGFLFKEKITQFPYNYFPNAQYVGTTSLLIGFSLMYHSAAGILISMLIYGQYQILWIVENRKLKVFYPSSPENIKKSSD